MVKLFKFVFGLVIVIAIVAVVGRCFFFELARTKSYDMVPNLVAGDVFLVWTVHGGNLGEGDVALCENPEDPSELIALRVIGVPGDEVAFWQNHVRLNGEVVQHSVEDPIMYIDNTSGEELEYAVNVAEEYVGGMLYHVALMDRAGGKDARSVVVPEGQFFVAGDNRNMARDSRNFGTIPIESCIGKAFFLLWPGEDSGDLRRGPRLLSKL